MRGAEGSEVEEEQVPGRTKGGREEGRERRIPRGAEEVERREGAAEGGRGEGVREEEGAVVAEDGGDCGSVQHMRFADSGGRGTVL